MTKTELQLFNSLLLKQRETNKKTAGIFLDTLSDIACKATKKTGEFVVPGLGKRALRK
jgi:hypothetical protein